EARTAIAAAAEALELLENPRLICFGQARPLVGDDHAGAPCFLLEPDPYLRVLGRIADRVGDQVDQHLQHATEFGDRWQALAIARRVEHDALVARADAE